MRVLDTNMKFVQKFEFKSKTEMLGKVCLKVKKILQKLKISKICSQIEKLEISSKIKILVMQIGI